MDGETFDDIDSFIYEHKMDLLNMTCIPQTHFTPFRAVYTTQEVSC